MLKSAPSTITPAKLLPGARASRATWRGCDHEPARIIARIAREFRTHSWPPTWCAVQEDAILVTSGLFSSSAFDDSPYVASARRLGLLRAVVKTPIRSAIRVGMRGIQRGLAAVGAAVVGAGSFALGKRSANPRPSREPELCGTYKLVPGASLTSGLLTYQPEGHVASHIVRRMDDGRLQYSGYSGKWWIHNASTSFAATYPPHDGSLVEHEVTAASDATLVGQSYVRRYMLSDDGHRALLTTAAVNLKDGTAVESDVVRWQRL